jgi:hypothetical protein
LVESAHFQIVPVSCTEKFPRIFVTDFVVLVFRRALLDVTVYHDRHKVVLFDLTSAWQVRLRVSLQEIRVLNLSRVRFLYFLGRRVILDLSIVNILFISVDPLLANQETSSTVLWVV